MSAAECFVDTNVLLYLLSGDQRKADRAEEVLAGGATISVQVLNEFASVASRKLGMSLTEVQEALEHGCAWLCTEDLQDGQVIEKSLTIRNPFRQ